MSEPFPVKALTGTEYMTQAEVRAYSGFWVGLLGKKRSLSTEGLMQTQAGMGKLPGNAASPEEN